MAPSVFISYSHRDEAWKDRLLHVLGSRADATRVTVWNDRQIAPGAEWFTDIETAMNHAAIAVCLITCEYLQSRFCTEYEVGPLLARRERAGLVLVPVLIAPCEWESVHWLKPIQMLPRDGKTIAVDFAGREDELLAEVAAAIVKVVDDPSYRPPAAPAGPMPDAVDLTRLPYTGVELVGRDAELARLRIAWRAFDTHVVCLTGWGGVGKTTLVNTWLERLAADGYHGARRVFGWSFSGQSDRELEGSADAFVQTALEWFGDASPRWGSPWSKGERLAALVAAEPTLLVLDGIEVVQSTTEHGRITDPALATLLVELARRNPGLCIVNSREPVADLQPYMATVAFENLERLSPPAGRALLRLGGVRGVDDQRLEAASRALNGHALALRLLAARFRDGHQRGELALANLIGEGPVAEGEETARILTPIEPDLEGGPLFETLALIAVLDGTADPDALQPLVAEPVVDGLNTHTHALGETGWQRVARDLRRRALLSPEDDRWPDRLEAHPLVARHFEGRLRSSAPDAWTTAHRRLVEHHASRVDADGAPVTASILSAISHSARVGDVGRSSSSPRASIRASKARAPPSALPGRRSAR
jgi:hypothetical protein